MLTDRRIETERLLLTNKLKSKSPSGFGNAIKKNSLMKSVSANNPAILCDLSGSVTRTVFSL